MRAERAHGTLEGFDVFVDVHVQNMPISHKNKSIIGLIKTFTENWDRKRHLLELSWPI